MFSTLDAVLILVVFLIPGYVWRTVEAQFAYLDRRLQWEKFALGLLARSTVVYSLFFTLIYRAWQEDWIQVHPLIFTILAICLVGILPAMCGLFFGIGRQWNWMRRLIRFSGLRTFEENQIPTAWDYKFSQIRPSWAIITLADGSKLYGYVGPESYFSSDPEARDLYISHVLQLDESGKMSFVENTAGVYVNKDRISLIEFRSIDEE